MSDQTIENADVSRISRRSALKAGVGVGVGAVAWTGPQITSFGATPAYATGCTFVETFDFYGGWKATNQRSNCNPTGSTVFNMAYNTPTQAPPAGFFFVPGFGFPQGNDLCGGETIKIAWPEDRNLDCVLVVRVRYPAQDPFYEEIFGGSTDGSYCTGTAPDQVCYDTLAVQMPTGVEVGTQDPDTNPSGTDPAPQIQYSVVLYCFSEGAAEKCIDDLDTVGT